MEEQEKKERKKKRMKVRNKEGNYKFRQGSEGEAKRMKRKKQRITKRNEQKMKILQVKQQQEEPRRSILKVFGRERKNMTKYKKRDKIMRKRS